MANLHEMVCPAKDVCGVRTLIRPAGPRMPKLESGGAPVPKRERPCDRLTIRPAVL